MRYSVRRVFPLALAAATTLAACAEHPLETADTAGSLHGAKGGGKGSGGGGADPGIEGTALGTLSGTNATAGGINDAGIIVGHSRVEGGATRRAFVLVPGSQMAALPTLAGDARPTVASRINAGGVIVGHIDESPFVPLRWRPVAADTWEVEELALPPGWIGGVPEDVNDEGRAVGQVRDAGEQARAVLWESDGTPLVIPGDPAWTIVRAGGINSAGHVVGSGRKQIGRTILFDAWIWRGPATATEILPPYGANTEHWADDINDAGQIVGRTRDTKGVFTAVLWSPKAGGGYDVQHVTVSNSTQGPAINECGQVIGSRSTRFTHTAFIWTQAAGITDLKPAPGWENSNARDVNQMGQVVGWSNTDGWIAGGTGEATLWEVPPCNT